jgi:hypothetical protein
MRPSSWGSVSIVLKDLKLVFKWLAGAALVSGAIVLLTYKEHQSRIKYQRTCQEHSAAVVAPSSEQNISSADECQDPKSYMPWWYVLLAWPEGITTWAVLATGFAIAWQSYETRRSVQAARTQAAHMIVSERAWLIIRSSMVDYVPKHFDDQWRFWWVIENTGDTPARIIETQCLYEIVECTELLNFPNVLKYPEPIKLNGFLVPPGGKVDYDTFIRAPDGRAIKPSEMDVDVIEAIEREHRHLRVYGYVRYLDVFNKKRESRFCEYYVWPFKTRPERATGFRPLIGAPPESTECT